MSEGDGGAYASREVGKEGRVGREPVRVGRSGGSREVGASRIHARSWRFWVLVTVRPSPSSVFPPTGFCVSAWRPSSSMHPNSICCVSRMCTVSMNKVYDV